MSIVYVYGPRGGKEQKAALDAMMRDYDETHRRDVEEAQKRIEATGGDADDSETYKFIEKSSDGGRVLTRFKEQSANYLLGCGYFTRPYSAISGHAENKQDFARAHFTKG